MLPAQHILRSTKRSAVSASWSASFVTHAGTIVARQIGEVRSMVANPGNELNSHTDHAATVIKNMRVSDPLAAAAV